MNNFFGKVIGFLLLAGILFGLFVLVTAPFEMLKKSEAESWPSRPGVVTKSYASYHRGSASKHGGGPYWKAEICGTYKDTQEKFCVSRIRYGDFRFGAGQASALETVAKYPAGSEVNIHYSPEDPKETVLEARSSWTEMLVLLGLGAGFLALPLLLWIFRKRIDPKKYGEIK